MTRDKHSLVRFIAWLKVIKTWQLVVILIIMVVLSASLLRLNNLGMVERRDAVKAADEKGDRDQLKQSIIDLQNYVSSHMNTSLGDNGFYLEKSYERDRDKAIEALASETNPNADVYQEAALECQSRFQGGVESFRNDYVQCVASQVAELSSAEAGEELALPKADRYRIDYVSPALSFDLAGLSVLISILLFITIISRLLLLALLRLLLSRRFKTV